MIQATTPQVLAQLVQTLTTLLASLEDNTDAVQARVLRGAIADVLGEFDAWGRDTRHAKRYLASMDAKLQARVGEAEQQYP